MKAWRGVIAVAAGSVLLACCLFPGNARAQPGMGQFCWAVGTFDRTMYFAEAEEREDREIQFIELLRISGVEFSEAKCLIQRVGPHRIMRDYMLGEWLKGELEIVDTTFMSDLDY